MALDNYPVEWDDYPVEWDDYPVARDDYPARALEPASGRESVNLGVLRSRGARMRQISYKINTNQFELLVLLCYFLRSVRGERCRALGSRSPLIYRLVKRHCNYPC